MDYVTLARNMLREVGREPGLVWTSRDGDGLTNAAGADGRRAALLAYLSLDGPERPVCCERCGIAAGQGVYVSTCTTVYEALRGYVCPRWDSSNLADVERSGCSVGEVPDAGTPPPGVGDSHRNQRIERGA